jgi:hypothetical protein
LLDVQSRWMATRKRKRLDISGWRFEPSAQLRPSQYKRNITRVSSVARLTFEG